MRRAPNMTERLACLLIERLEIPREIARGMTAEAICALVEWDHAPVAFNVGRDLGWAPERIHHPTNLEPMFSEDHDVKTMAVDRPASDKSERITAEHEAFRARMLAKAGADAPETSRTKQRTALRSRGFVGHRRFDGTQVWKHGKRITE